MYPINKSWCICVIAGPSMHKCLRHVQHNNQNPQLNAKLNEIMHHVKRCTALFNWVSFICNGFFIWCALLIGKRLFFASHCVVHKSYSCIKFLSTLGVFVWDLLTKCLFIALHHVRLVVWLFGNLT